jgi:DNA-3-methyladenine glycosylase I
MTGGSVLCDDGVVRCPWGVSPPELRRHHDEEWGRPVGDDDRIFQKLCLEGFQSGLSWLTILRKLENFRKAFANFDPVEVADFDQADIERLMADPGIVRNRAKVLATINNARAALGLRDAGTSLASLLWKYEPRRRRAPRTMADLQSVTSESTTLAAELRRAGFRFVGPTTVFAAMQDLGVVNDHLSDCHYRPIIEQERSRFARPA